MKITNWWRKLSAAIVAAGISVPGIAYAVDIPLGDPSFEAFTLAPGSYAYSSPFNGQAWRPTSAWVDDLDNPPFAATGGGYATAEDLYPSFWLYDAAYVAAQGGTRKNPIPRTGTQAQHTLGGASGGNYAAQETSAVFEAGKTYTFSIWAQADTDSSPNPLEEVFLYIFDGSLPFSEANSLTFQRFQGSAFNVPGDGSDYLRRQQGDDDATSLTLWTQISLSHDVLAGAPEIGHTVGVGFGYLTTDDTALDDATLDVSPTSAGLIGDYNDDDRVDAADYVVWRKFENTTNTLPNDPIGGTIGSGQYDNWRTHFGEPPPGAGLGAGSVPEPGSLVLMAMGLLPLGARYPRRER